MTEAGAAPALRQDGRAGAGTGRGAAGHRFLFVGGLHRSGTSALYRLLATDPRISCFGATGVIEDEGQYLQGVCPTEDSFGGPGAFALDPEAHWTESSPLVAAAKERLFAEWAPYWNLAKPILAEKTPANIIRARFLDAVFPGAAFLFLMRHPVANVLATSKWTPRSATALIENWIATHTLLFDDLPRIGSAEVVKYEDMTRGRGGLAHALARLIGGEPAVDWSVLEPGHNRRYFAAWSAGAYHLWAPRRSWRTIVKRWKNLAEAALIERRFERAVNRFGYSFEDIHEDEGVEGGRGP